VGKELTFALGLGAERGVDAFTVIPLALDGTQQGPIEVQYDE
jgi:hypothetical protein